MSTNKSNKLTSGLTRYESSCQKFDEETQEQDKYTCLEPYLEYLMDNTKDLQAQVLNVDQYIGPNVNNFTRRLIGEGYSVEDAQNICFSSLLYLFMMNTI